MSRRYVVSKNIPGYMPMDDEPFVGSGVEAIIESMGDQWFTSKDGDPYLWIYHLEVDE